MVLVPRCLSFILAFVIAWPQVALSAPPPAAGGVTCSGLLGILRPSYTQSGQLFSEEVQILGKSLNGQAPDQLQDLLLRRLQTQNLSSEDQWKLLASYFVARDWPQLSGVFSQVSIRISPRQRVLRKPLQWVRRWNGQTVLNLWKPQITSKEDLQNHLWLLADVLFQIQFQRRLWSAQASLPKQWPLRTKIQRKITVENLLEQAKMTAVDIPLTWQSERIEEMADFEVELYNLYNEVQGPRLKARDPGRHAWKFMFGIDSTTRTFGASKAKVNRHDEAVWRQQGRAGLARVLTERYQTPLLLSWYFDQVKRASFVYFTSKMLIIATIFSVTTLPTMIEGYRHYQEIHQERVEQNVQKGPDGEEIINDRYMSEEYEMALQRRSELEDRIAQLQKSPVGHESEIKDLQVQLDALMQQYFS